MANPIPETAALLKEVEQKYGRKVNTSTDFESLSVVIEREIGEYVSASTLKRLWGYVSLKPTPRVATLDVLCHFIGWHSFEDYRKGLQRRPDSESGFFSTSCISAADLKKGECILIGWQPNRLAKLEYLGQGKFRVVESENTKLRKGDVFSSAQFLLGYPLYLDRIERESGPTPPYVAGRNGGLNRVERL